KELELKLKEGDVAPEFSAATSGGGKVSRADFKGKDVVLYFYPRDDTPGCTMEAKEFNESLDDMESKGAVVIGVSKDTLESHEKFRKKYGLEFLLLSDPDSRVIKLYESYGDK